MAVASAAAQQCVNGLRTADSSEFSSVQLGVTRDLAVVHAEG